MNTQPHLTAIANKQRHPQKVRTGYKLVHCGKTVIEHSSPSFLTWYKTKHALNGALVMGVYV